MIGSRIALLRHSAGLSQQELAKRLHVSPSALGMYEQGRREPSITTLIALSREFGVTVDYLLLGKSDIRNDIASSSNPQVDQYRKIALLQDLPRREIIVLLIMELAKY